MARTETLEDVPVGVVWDEAILDAIESARTFLLILSSRPTPRNS